MPWYSKLFSLVRSRRIADLMQFPDAESLGINAPASAISFARPSRLPTDRTSAPWARRAVWSYEHRSLANAAKKLLGRIRQPALIVHSREDDYANLNNATYLQAKLPSASDFLILDDSYHMVTLDKQRHVVVERTRAFIERITAGGNSGTGAGSDARRPVEAA